MLKDNEIEALIQPYVERQQKLNMYVVNKIANRIGQIGSLSSTDVYRLQQLYKIGEDARLINQEIAKVLNVQVGSVKDTIRRAAIKTYTDAKPFYDYRHKAQIPYEKNTKLQRTVNAISKQTEGTFKNLSNSKATGFMIRDMKNPQLLKFQNVQQTYQSIVDEAVQAVQNGTMDFDSALSRSLKQLNESGLRRAYWDSGYTRRIDSTVRMNILGGIRQINQQVQMQIAQEINADGIELSAHSFSAPDHEPIQGRIFTMKEFEKLQSEMDFEDITHTKFIAIRRPIGEWNCMHIAMAFSTKYSKRQYTDAQLKKWADDNEKGCMIGGKHYTTYEAAQLMRQIETQVRREKDTANAARIAGDDVLRRECQIRINNLARKYQEVVQASGLKVRKERMSVEGFRMVKV